MPKGNHSPLWWIFIGWWWRPPTWLFTRKVSEKDVKKEVAKLRKDVR